MSIELLWIRILKGNTFDGKVHSAIFISQIKSESEQAPGNLYQKPILKF